MSLSEGMGFFNAMLLSGFFLISVVFLSGGWRVVVTLGFI